MIDTAALRDYVERVADATETKAIAREALDRYEALGEIGDLTADELEPIVLAATSRFVLAWSIGADLLLDLATRSGTAADIVLRLVATGRVNEKLPLIASLSRNVPEDFAAELLRFAIHDRSSRVRVKAAEAIVRLELDLVDELRRQVENETHRVAKSQLERWLVWGTVGYEVEHEDDGSASVSVWHRGCLTGFHIAAAEIAAGRLVDRVEETRRRIDRDRA